jgi:hypothetical protein
MRTGEKQAAILKPLSGTSGRISICETRLSSLADCPGRRCRRGKSAVAMGDTYSFFRPEKKVVTHLRGSLCGPLDISSSPNYNTARG